jgi:hypothetical protein
MSQSETPRPPEFTDADKRRAQQWFDKAKELREKRDYDYAIQAYITGLGIWTEAVQEAHMPLWSLAVQRQQTGGKKPGAMERLKQSISTKNPKDAVLNAELLLAKDPGNPAYLDGFLKSAIRANLPRTLKWIAPRVFESLFKEKKPTIGRFKNFRQMMIEAAEKADAWGDPQFAAWCYEQAVNSIDFLLSKNPGDMTLKDEQRDLSGKLTIARGKYEEADSFRDSILDADKQKLLHDADRGKQGDETLDTLIQAERKEYEANPTVPGKINAYVKALLKPERRKEEDVAIQVLTKAYQELENYSFKQMADDVRLRQLHRQTRRWKERAAQTNKEEDQQQHRLALMEERQTELDVFRERVQKYPTDLRMKFHLGRTLFNAGDYDEAIPVLQEASAEPRYRTRAQVMIGRAFFEKESYAQAAAVLNEVFEAYESVGDDLSKDMLYWIGRAFEADRQLENAAATYGKLLRMDYNFADGDARRRHDELKQKSREQPG